MRVRILNSWIASLTSRSFPPVRCFSRSKLQKPPSHPHSPPGNPFSKPDRIKLSRGIYPRSTHSKRPNKPIINKPEKPTFSPLKLINNHFYTGPGFNLEDFSAKLVVPGSNIVLGPYAHDHEVREVEFVKSSIHTSECLDDNRPEFAFFGAFNAGKSSLLNALVGQNELAICSMAPGRTRSIDHYLINKEWFLVDLPGYGDIRISKTIKMSEKNKIEYSSFTKSFIKLRANLAAVLLLIDSSVPPKQTDLDCASWLGHYDIPITLVFTKCDLLRKNKEGKGSDVYLKELKELMGKKYAVHPPWIMTSSKDGSGLNDLLLHIAQIRNHWNET